MHAYMYVYMHVHIKNNIMQSEEEITSLLNKKEIVLTVQFMGGLYTADCLIECWLIFQIKNCL